jgi:membrane fusion protein (multidrug efflux system)
MMLVAGAASDGRAAAEAPAARAVIVAPARQTAFVDRIEALGTTRANETVQITSNVTEKVADIRFDDGQRVAAGDILVVLTKSEEVADLGAAEAVLEERRVAYERAQKLESMNFASTATLDERRAALRGAEANITMIQSHIDDRVIEAPFGGVVGLRNISVGALVEPGDLITTLDDLSVIKLDFSVPATYLAELQPGLKIVATSSAFGSRPFDGEVQSVDSRVDPVTRSIVARAVLPNDDGVLRPGLLMTVTLLKQPRTAILVPEEALIPQGRQNYVLVVDEDGEGAGVDSGTVVRREVTIGSRQKGDVEIRDGLDVGEKVVTHGTMLVRPGQRVTIRAVEETDQPLDRLLAPSDAQPPVVRQNRT